MNLLTSTVQLALQQLNAPEGGTVHLLVNDPDRATPSGSVVAALRHLRPDLHWSITIACGTHQHSPERRHQHLCDHHLEDLDVTWHVATQDSPLPPCPILAIGSVEPHWFAGWTGAHKTLTVGRWSHQRIEANHALALLPTATPCLLQGNPIFDALARAIADLTRLHPYPVVALNVVTAHDAIVAAASGSPLDALQRVIPAARQHYVTSIPTLADRIIAHVASPLSRSLYQALKAVKNNASALRDGGALILVAPCEDGVGIDHFVKMLACCPTWETANALIQQRGYRLGDHKAVRLLHLLNHRKLQLACVCSPHLRPEDAALCGMTPFADLDTALQWARHNATGPTEITLHDAANQVLTVEPSPHVEPYPHVENECA